MGRFNIVPEGIAYDAYEDVWLCPNGSKYIKNEFDPTLPLWIEISRNEWKISYLGINRKIDWDTYILSPDFVFGAKRVLKEKLKKSSPTYITMWKVMLQHLQKSIPSHFNNFEEMNIPDILDVWMGLPPSYRIFFRTFYQHSAQRKLIGARADIAYEMDKWNARTDVMLLRSVVQWHPTRGALTASEEAIVRKSICEKGGSGESVKDQGVRIFAWILLETLKRPSQALEISADGLKSVSNNGVEDWFLEIKPIKYQTGLSKRWWHITNGLAEEILSFKRRPTCIHYQKEFNKLLVWDSNSLQEHGVISATEAGNLLTQYFVKRSIRSPRTGDILHLTPQRIRHTGATRLAFAGVSRDVIQEILEHDSPQSCQAYIDAIGSEIVPAIEKAGRMSGNIFYHLNQAFFQGKVVNEPSGPPIVIPDHKAALLVVGSCGRDPIKNGLCQKHPFLSCYAGCHSFMAWAETKPHEKALEYMETQKERWQPSCTQKEVLSIPVREALEQIDIAILSAKQLLREISQGEQ